MTKILAWDVGIKHLAYCILEVDEETKKFNIMKWENIDLTDVEQHTCSCISTNGKRCTVSAKFLLTINDETKYYCGKHKKQYTVNVVDIENQHVKKYESKTKELCQHQTNKNKCTKKANYSFDNMLCCKPHKDSLLKQKFKELSLKSIKTTKCTATGPQILCERMYKKLSAINEFSGVDEVYIENQPTLKNPTMKAVSSMLFSYFVYLFTSNELANRTVKFVSPSFKIKIDDSLINIIEGKQKSHDKVKKENCKCRFCKLCNEISSHKEKFDNKYDKYKLSYDAVKELGIVYTEKILIDHDIKDKLDMINKYDKKDDLCDAFLHGYKKTLNNT